MCDQYISQKTVRDIYVALCSALAAGSGNVRAISEKFSELETNSSRVDFVYELLEKYGAFPKLNVINKNAKVATDLREKGNDFFKMTKDGFAIMKYTESLANAPLDSQEYALAFANRSAALFRLKLYKQCLKDIEKALSGDYPKHLHDKLTTRREKAVQMQTQQVKMMYHEDAPVLGSTNEFIECAANCVEIRSADDHGRHIVARRDIKIGDVIAVEEPFTTVLLKDKYLSHCYNCLRPCFNLIPCDNCVLIMFCKEGCKRLAWDTYHKYECSILPTLLDLDLNKLTLAALKISILVDLTQGNDKGSTYKSRNYSEIHDLITNTRLRSTSDLFERAVTAAIIFELVRKHTKLFVDGAKKQETFKELLLLHLQTGPSNFHEISEMAKNGSFYELDEIGVGAYSFLSLLNHSCCPNVVRHCYDRTIVLRALRPIVKGEQLFDNYGYHHAVMKKEQRREHLHKQYFFECRCEACVENWPLYIELPKRHFDIKVSEEEIESLRNGSTRLAKDIAMNLQNLAEGLEKLRPCKELADVQEILKQCYALCGNKRITF
ncbi:hypothetical protein RN001_013284 [Aquatica leii]|uniref:Protein-lysine N-methyltransferase SMYD4 n=1 Tax=Aquatica leii TaxID=1421715 RepID=A0AAN7NZX2_9COLE|nr:hypothetical protein RN001_013284 [Aquatica leii]